MEENCGGGQGLNWAVEPRRESGLLSYGTMQSVGGYVSEEHITSIFTAMKTPISNIIYTFKK
jgi:hypothetical protein